MKADTKCMTKEALQNHCMHTYICKARLCVSEVDITLKNMPTPLF